MTNACKYTVQGYIRLDVSIVLGKDLPRVGVSLGGPPSLRDNTGDRFDGNGICAGPLRGDTPPQPTWKPVEEPQQEKEEQGGSKNPNDRPPPGLRNTVSRESSTRNVGWDGREFLCVSVSDTGIGVTNDKKSLLFKPFTQVQGMQSGEREVEGLSRH